MLDMIADYQRSKREDTRSAGAPQTAADLLTTRCTSGTSITTNVQTTSTAVAAVLVTTNSTMDKSVVTATAFGAEAMTTTKLPRRQKKQVKEFNDVISCSLCRGYLVNATSIDICEHSFCRSCIVRYLETENYCPKCKPLLRYINLSNLRSDEILRTLVYKLVPGFIHRERERQLQFWKALDSATDCDMLMMEEEFFYPDEPISLSLEYHPDLLMECNKTEIPQVRYLQCPAGVTVHHLKRLICCKYDIDPANQLVKIDIIYEGEILPKDFSLIDVAYCYKWKRVAPMRFCYRILVHNNPPLPPAIRSAEVETTPQDIKLGESNQNDGSNTEAKRVKNSTDGETMMAPAAPVKTVRFLEPTKKVEKNGENNRQITYSVFKSKSQDSKDSSGHHNNNNNNETEREKNEGNGTMKMIIARKQSPKRSNSDELVYNITNDFKSLRSNDMRYSDYTVTSTTSGGTPLNKKPKEDSKPVVTKCDIVVSIPQSQISPNSSDESSENLSLAELKTAGKKTNTNSTTSSASKKNVPKLKIELNSLKTKITIPKPKSAEVRQEPKKISKRKLSIDERPMSDKVDLKTYAKNIGLKPIDMEKSLKADLLEPSKPKTSPDASPMSTASSTGSSTSNGTFSFTANDGCASSSSSHKKRKKKHSKEPKDSNGKRRKLHAEISSQPADESLKMKVKITGSHNHRPHKVDTRKSSSSSDEVVITIPTTTKLPPPVANPPQTAIAATAVNGNDQRKSPKTAPSPPSQQNPQIPSANNFNISNLNRTLSEESSNITNLMNRREADVSKKSTEAKVKSSAPQIMTTIHSRIPPNPQITSTSATKTPLPKPLASIQEMKVHASPPLPPSLFKTTPLTIPTITATSTKAATSPKPVRTTMNPPAISVGQSNRPPKLAPATPKTQFAVPHPPQKSIPNSPKLCTIPSIASSANKHAAQLKRSASLDGPHPTSLLTKQQKIDQDQDRLNRKSAYGPMFNHQHRPARSTNPSAPTKTLDKPFYTSAMSLSYTHEMSKRKPLPLLMPPSSISVTKMNDSPMNPKTTHSSASSSLTITSQQKHQHKSYGHQNNQKPTLEIMRIPASTASEHKPMSNKSSPPKATRPPPPTIPLVKIKKSQSQTLPVRSPALTVCTKTTTSHSQASPPGLISMRSMIPAIVASKSAATSAENAPKQPEKPSSETNGKPPKEKSSSSKDRRSSSKDGNVDILDLSGKQAPSSSTPIPGNSLEAALNKIKQNITSSTVPDSIAAANKSPKVENSPEDLQNLHMLSESATNREKIAIKTLPKLNEISKVRSSQTSVRQQNASVRNIPNPSALAFRNQPAIPMLNSINNKTTPISPPTGVSQPEFKIPTPPSSSPSSSTNPASPPRLKKNLNIEQVAANLNMRAAAAADKSEALSTAVTTAVTSVSSASVVSTSRPESTTTAKITKAAAVVTSSNVVSSSSSAAPAVAVSSRESGITPTPPKTSFKSISSLVASSSSSSTISAGTA